MADGPRPFQPKDPGFKVDDPTVLSEKFEKKGPVFVIEESWPDPTRAVGVTLSDEQEIDEDTPRFGHACCHAVRPNPLDTEFPGGRPEPYVVDQTILKPTMLIGVWLALAGIAGTLAWILSYNNLPIGAIASAAVAGGVVLYIFLSFLIANGAQKNIRLQAVRHIDEANIERGRIFHATLDTGGSFIPGSLRVTVTDQNAPGIRPVEHPQVPAGGSVKYRVRPQARGLVSFKGLEVEVRSGDGLWQQERQYRFRTTIQVAPSLSAVSWNATLSGYVPFGLGTPDFLVKLYRDVETEINRPYMPGDRMKDIDWKRMAISNQMVIRRRESESETTILLAFDMGATMLMDQAGFRNVDLAVEVATELMTWGLRRNHEVGLIAFNENEIVDHVRPTRAKIQIKTLQEHVRYLADHHLPEEGEKPPKIRITGNPENLRMGLGYGLKQRNTAGITVILFSDMQSIHEDIVQGLSKAAESGQRVLSLFMAGPKLRPVSAKGLATEIRGEDHTNKMRELLLARGVQFIELNPYDHDTSLLTEEEMEVMVEGWDSSHPEEAGATT